MFSSEKKEVGSWWFFILFMIGLTFIVLFGLKFMGVFGERVVFENSHQYKQSRLSELATYEAQLAEIETQLSGELDNVTKQNLEAQAAMLRMQLNQARNK